MASAGPTNTINEQALRWAVETAHGEMSPGSRAELDAWLDADPRHRGAYVRARAWMRATENAVVETHAARASEVPAASELASVPSNDNPQAVEPSRAGGGRWTGRLVAGGGALAASVAVMIALGTQGGFRRAAPIPAPAGRIMALKDGSVATLGRDARIEVAFSADHRRITLLSGSATFKVAKDKAHPFVVRSGDVYAQATGTLYSVGRVGSNGGAVKVTEGSVLVWARDEQDRAVLLHAGGSLTLDPGASPRPGPEAAPPRPRTPELAQISLDDERISAAVVRFNRINSTKIVIADPGIGATRIIGLYRANDPERFAQAVAAVAGAEVAHEQGRIVIKMK